MSESTPPVPSPESDAASDRNIEKRSILLHKIWIWRGLLAIGEVKQQHLRSW
ncbi:MAG: hypothetical protein KME11_04370 [Timaviella obliquedivisa GSE-PSE-MK23-08B]|nr:hypothetical protein [Timaviella obliquedivisa GSE-PSE-MK23-08B]